MVISNAKDLKDAQIVCKSPTNELVVRPRWIPFYSECNYKKPICAKFSIQNIDKFPVVYTIKVKHKLFKISDHGCGILKPDEKKELKLFLLSSDDWNLAVGDYVQKKINIFVENLQIPDDIVPENQAEGVEIAKNIWKRSSTEWPWERLHTKLRVFLEKCETSKFNA
ncbi:unnamed protein product [Caenorhabditis bovis]|uniref:MSP domain-containing protein n=1 Tax=Caenorhabditis bovis TaxID=2654633 RepID=A0A8S1EWB6_9PELO|nr:unnamed protein product [Caenorhabditis bovis]